MKPWRNLLLATDFSDASRPAMRRGADLAKQFDARVHLMHGVLLGGAVPVYPMFDTVANMAALREQVLAQAKKSLTELRDQLGLSAERTEIVLREGSFAAPLVLDYAREAAADLIVLGTHGWRGFRHLLLGSVAEEVVRKANCSVITFRPDLPARGDRPKTIVAAVDLSDLSLQLIERARALADLYHATVEVLHVVPEIFFPPQYDLVPVVYPDLGELEERARQSLHQLAQNAGGPPVEAHLSVVRGVPDREIVKFAKAKSADLLVLASRGLTGLDHLLLGSVTDKVLRQAECPVLTLHMDKRREALRAVS